MCKQCQIFLYDFLLVGPHKDLAIAKEIRVQAISKILPVFVDWSLRMGSRIQPKEFEKALETSSRIARRGRKMLDYEYLIHTATFNFLKFSLSWLTEEVEFMKLLLLEAGVVKGREYAKAARTAQDYLSYVLPRTILVLKDLHEDHRNPKGIYTDLGKLFPRQRQADEDTCFDRDDYQKEILEEVDLDDLYN